MLGEVRRMRERMKEVADETRRKDNLYKQLVSAWSEGVREGGSYGVCVCVHACACVCVCVCACLCACVSVCVHTCVIVLITNS